MRHTLTARSFTPPPVAALADEARIHLKAARMWVMLARHQRNPRPVIASLLGAATPAFCTLMEQVVTAWPDAFTTYPPCAAGVTPDEATLLSLLDLAATGDTPGTHRLLEDLLPDTDRHRLCAAARRAAPAGIAF
jgi:hypothetical protein